MRSRVLSRGAHQWIISILLVAVVVRALIPVGFMPAADRPFSFQICPDTFAAHLLPAAQAKHDQRNAANELTAHHHHAGDDQAQAPAHEGAPHPGHGSHEYRFAHAEHCVFAAAALAGPAPQGPLVVAPDEESLAPQFHTASPLTEIQRYRTPQPRAPPALS